MNEPHSSEILPNSNRTYLPGQIHPGLRVPFREITLTPTKSYNGHVEVNEPARVYDCSGPWSDSAFTGDVEHGLPALRQPWIRSRGGLEEVEQSYKPIPGRSTASIPPSLQRKALRAKAGRAVTQLHY